MAATASVTACSSPGGKNWYAIGLYALAKAAEMKDMEVFTLTDRVVSGHTLKHLLAAGAIFALLVMLRRRAPIDA